MSPPLDSLLYPKRAAISKKRWQTTPRDMTPRVSPFTTRRTTRCLGVRMAAQRLAWGWKARHMYCSTRGARLTTSAAAATPTRRRMILTKGRSGFFLEWPLSRRMERFSSRWRFRLRVWDMQSELVPTARRYPSLSCEVHGTVLCGTSVRVARRRALGL